nr:immunoglobulin light chain junction region [Macaca mulatta]
DYYCLIWHNDSWLF